jgi:hypothetical protein
MRCPPFLASTLMAFQAGLRRSASLGLGRFSRARCCIPAQRLRASQSRRSTVTDGTWLPCSAPPAGRAKSSAGAAEIFNESWVKVDVYPVVFMISFASAFCVFNIGKFASTRDDVYWTRQSAVRSGLGVAEQYAHKYPGCVQTKALLKTIADQIVSRLTWVRMVCSTTGDGPKPGPRY